MVTQNPQFNFTVLKVESILVLDAVKWGEKRENRRFSRSRSGAFVLKLPHTCSAAGVKNGGIQDIDSG